MKLFKQLLLLFSLFFGGTICMNAQTSVTVGNQVKEASNIVSGNAYLIKYTSMTGTPYIYDAGTATPLQAPSTQNAATTACAFYFISDGNGAYKLRMLIQAIIGPHQQAIKVCIRPQQLMPEVGQ